METKLETLKSNLTRAYLILDSSKIWGGMGWKRNSLDPIKTQEALELVRTSIENLTQLQSELTQNQ